MRILPVVAGVVAAVLALPAAAQFEALDPSDVVMFYVAKDDNGEIHPDGEFARWALDAWSKASNGVLRFAETETESDAIIRIYWAGPSSRKYGEMRGIMVDGKRGAEVYVNTATDGLGDDVHKRAMRDQLYRDCIVYLTCVHEIGHAVGLSHTDKFKDIMYSFQYGGDIKRYFLRYRKKVKTRGQMIDLSPMSDNDIARLSTLY